MCMLNCNSSQTVLVKYSICIDLKVKVNISHLLRKFKFLCLFLICSMGKNERERKLNAICI